MWKESFWYVDYSRRALCRTRAGEYTEGSIIEVEMEVDFFHLPGLVEAARDNGLIPIQMSPEGRGEDLKIVHRLLDIMEAK